MASRFGKAHFIKSRVWGRILILALCANASSAAGVYAQSVSSHEYRLKAAFLYNFAKFIDWPAKAFTDDTSPMSLCVLGEDPFGAALESIKNKTVRGRKLVIKRFRSAQAMEFCHIVFISSSEKAQMTHILASLSHLAVLTVGEMESFTQLGGVINFTIVGNKIRFEINVDASERAGLRVSSKLLRLAKVVKIVSQGGKF